VIDTIVMASVVCQIKWRELPVFDHWPNTDIPKFLTQIVPVIPFVSGDGLWLVEIPRNDLPSDVGVVRLCHRAMNSNTVLVLQSTNAVVLTDLKV